MNLFSSLFARHDTPTHVDHATIDLHDVSYHYDHESIGLAPTTCHFATGTGNCAIIGLNGAGKSTLISLLGAQVLPSTGTIEVNLDGAVLMPTKRGDRKRIEQAIPTVSLEHAAKVFQRAPSIEEGLDQYLRAQHVDTGERATRISALLEQCDLLDVRHSAFAQCDHAHQHLVALALACALNPALVVADEPTRGLDEVDTARVARRLFTCGYPVIIATHDLDMLTTAAYNIERVLVMDDTRIVFDGTPQQASSYYAQLIRSKYEALTRQQ